MRKTIVCLTTVVLIFSVFAMSSMGAANHQGGGTTGEDITYSGINLTGYHWVYIDSDDWGIHNPWNPANVTELDYLVDVLGVYNKGFWGQSTLESVDDMDDLFAVLAKHNAPMTVNFVMEMIDGPEMMANGFTEYAGIPINDSEWYEQTKYNSSGPNYRGNINEKWVEGYTKGYWLPQYHGRLHAEPSWYLQNCSEGCKTTIDCVVNYSQFFLKLPGETAYPLPGGDYCYNPIRTVELGECNISTQDSYDNISIGLAEFYDLFGFYPETIVAGNYLVSNNTLAAFRNTTIYGVTSAPGMGYDLITGLSVNWGWYVFDYFDGISLIDRQILLDGSNITHLTTKMNAINTSFERGQLAAIIAHKTNYVSAIRDIIAPGERESALELLDALLTAIVTHYPDVWFLTSPEVHQLNIRGYSQQNWTREVVVRNAINNTMSIIVDLPPGWDSNVVTVTNSSGVSEDFEKGDSRTITLDVPHNETFTVHRNISNSPNYPTYDFSAVQAAVVAAVAVIIITSVVFKGLIGPISKSFGRNS